MDNTLDPNVVNLTKAIRAVESGADFTARGKSGEFGAYQFIPATWANASQKFLGAQVPLEQATPVQQNEVAYKQVKAWKDAGYNVGQVASMWNAGAGRPNAYLEGNKGVNSQGVSYDTADYARKVALAYQSFKANNPAGVHAVAPEAPAEQKNQYGAWFPADDSDTAMVSGLKMLGNVPSSAVHLVGGIASMLLHPVDTVKGIGNTIAGGLQEGAQGIGSALSGKDMSTENEATQTFDAVKQFFIDRYGSIDNAKRSAIEDPTGVLFDLATIFEGGGALVRAGGKALGVADASMASSQALATGMRTMAGDTAIGNTATRLGGTISGVGEAINPIRLGAQAVSAVGRGLAPKFGVIADGEALGAEARTGVRLPVSGVTKSMGIRELESMASRTFLGSTEAQARVERAVLATDQFAQGLVSKVGESGNLTDAGKVISEGLQAYTQKFKEANQAIFSQIEEKLGDVSAQSSKAIRAMQIVANNMKSIGNAPKIGKYDLETKLGVLQGAKGYAKPTLGTLRKMLSEVDDMLEKAYADADVMRSSRDLATIRRGIKQSILETVESTGSREAMDFYNQADAYYAKNVKEVYNAFTNKIRNLANEGHYEKIAEDLFKPTTAIEDIPAIMKVLGKDGVEHLQESVMATLMKKARNGEGDFTPQKLGLEMKKYLTPDGRNKLEVLLKPNQLQGMKDLATLTKALGDSLKLGQGSQTAFLHKSMLELGALGGSMYAFLSGDIANGLKLLGGVVSVEVAGKFITSARGQEFLRWVINSKGELEKLGYANRGNVVGNEQRGAQGDSGTDNNGGVRNNPSSPIVPAGGPDTAVVSPATRGAVDEVPAGIRMDAGTPQISGEVPRPALEAPQGKSVPIASAESPFPKEWGTAETFVDPKTSPLRTKQYAILTAENPEGVQLTPKANATRNKRLLEQLAKDGFTPVPVKGKYFEGESGQMENSFIVPNMTNEQALAYAKKFKQDSVLTKQGLIYKDGTVNPADISKINFDGNQTDFFTTVNIGGQEVKFSIPINFDRKVPLDELHTINLDHYSTQAGLRELSPEFAGSASAGTEKRYSQYPEFNSKGTYYYEQGAKPEAIVTDRAKNLYRVQGENLRLLTIGSKQAEALAQQSMEFIKKNKNKYGEANQDAMNAKMMDLAHEQGYDGIRSPYGVKLFKSMPAESAQEAVRKAVDSLKMGTPEQKAQLSSMYEKAPALKTELDTIVNDVAKEVGGFSALPPLKGYKMDGSFQPQRAMEKLVKSGKVTDLARGAVVVDNLQKANEAVRLLKERGVILGLGKDYFKQPTYLGYRGVNMNIKTPDGVGEIQVQVPEMMYVKDANEADLATIIGEKKFKEVKKKMDSAGIEFGAMHKLYEKVRTPHEANAKSEGRIVTDAYGKENVNWTDAEWAVVQPLIEESNRIANAVVKMMK